jgi:hypothetical protein
VAIDRKFIGYSLPTFTVSVDREQVRQFIAAIGSQADSALAPPTFMKVIEGANGSSRAIVSALGVDLSRVMHAEQEFVYGAPIRCGDQVTVERRVTDIYDRKGAALEFVVIVSTMHNSDGVLVGRSTQRILVRNSKEDVSA